MHKQSCLPICNFQVLIFLFSTSVASAQVSWVRHDITKSLRGGYGLHAVDLNKDGRMDFLSASRDGIRSWRNGGSGFSGSSIGSLEGAWSAFGADVDGDGDIDVAGASPHPNEQKVLLWLSGGGGVKDFPLLEAEDVCAADLDGDGIMEIIGVSWAEHISDPGNDLVYYKDYLTGPGTAVVIDPNLSGAHSVTAADFDKDGDIDLVASGDGRVNAYRNDGRGVFSSPKQLSTNGALCVNAYDVDGDGNLDFVGQERNPPNQNVYWWKGNGALGFSKNLVGTQIGESWGVHAGDVDGDGDMDITASSQDKRTIRAYINDGSQHFTELTVVENFGDAAGVRYAIPLDVEGDGDADIIGATPSGELAWFESITTPNIQVIAPNGDETWAVGGTEVITWNAINGINNVNIDFSTNSGTAWQPVASNLPNTGIYSWLIPNAISNSCRIRVSDASNALIKDVSDFNFAIVAPEFRITSPNGNENWYVGTTRTISWNDNQGIIPQVKIELSIDGGAMWQTIANAANNNGSYRWIIPNSPSNFCRIRISDAADGDPVDISDANFSILSPKLAITSPNGGESWDSGTSQNITWTTSGAVDNVKLEFSADGGVLWQTLFANLSNTGSFAWTVPDTNSSSCLIKVSDASDSTRFDISNNIFTISNPFLAVTFPNGGETLLLGSSQNITWNSSGQINQVKIELSRNGGNTWTTLAASTSNDGVHPWTVSGSASGNCLLRISDASDGTPRDVSDAAFALGSVAIAVVAPNGGETLFIGSTQSISWNSAGSINQVKIELSRDGGITWEVVAASTANDGLTNWTVSGEASNNCLLRISDAADGDPVDMSNAPFAISAIAITVIAPNGGETLYDTSQYEIQWSTTGPVNHVDLEYSLDNGASWQSIASNLANTGSYLWAAPDSLSDACLIRIADAADGSPQDVSDNTFRIVRFSRNHAPSAEIVGPYSAPRYVQIVFNASPSSDADGDSLTFTWDFGDGQSGNGVQATHAYSNVQNYIATLTVSDGNGGVSIAQTEVEIYNRPPIAVAAGPDYASIDSVLSFDAGASADPDGDNLTYAWSFGDSSAPYFGGPQASHVYGDSGSYQIVLHVQDNFGGSAYDTMAVLVTDNLKPIVDIRASEVSVISICANTYTIGLTIDQVHDPDGTIVSYEWDFGDGSPHSNSPSSLSHVFPVPGTYTVKLTVSDNEGAIGMDSVKIVLNHDYAPFASFSVPKDTVLVNSIVSFDASASQDHEGPIVTYIWNFGDGASETSNQPATIHIYQTLGVFQATLIVRDYCGNTTTVSRTLHVVLTTGIVEGRANPSDFGLAKNYPNPMALSGEEMATTRITFNLPTDAEMRLSIFNIFGQQVRTLVQGRQRAGRYTAEWDLRNDRGQRVSAGVYFYRLQASGQAATKKMVITR
jgi:PKD repeat protein